MFKTSSPQRSLYTRLPVRRAVVLVAANWNITALSTDHHFPRVAKWWHLKPLQQPKSNETFIDAAIYYRIETNWIFVLWFERNFVRKRHVIKCSRCQTIWHFLSPEHEFPSGDRHLKRRKEIVWLVDCLALLQRNVRIGRVTQFDDPAGLDAGRAILIRN